MVTESSQSPSYTLSSNLFHEELLRFRFPFPVSIQWMLSDFVLWLPQETGDWSLSGDLDVTIEHTLCGAFCPLWSDLRDNENQGKTNATGPVHSLSWTHTAKQAADIGLSCALCCQRHKESLGFYFPMLTM